MPVPPRRATPTRPGLPADELAKKIAWPEDRLAISPDGTTLLVPLNLADRAAIVDTAKARRSATSTVGRYPYGAGDAARRKRRALVSNETTGTV